MKNFVIAIIIQVVFIQVVSGQHTLPVPLDIQKTYEKGTRAFNGTPGKKYWQNRGEYHIQVYIDPVGKTITGQQMATYFNNSPDTLHNLVIRLYQDLYKKGNPRDFELAASDMHDGVNLKYISINGKPIEMSNIVRAGTNMTVPLVTNLLPGAKTEIELGWNYPISQTSTVREGYYQNHDSYFIAYWYPQIAVYDDVWGWNKFNFTGMQEFYNDFNNYHVEISAPKGFVVWATGTLRNPEANLAPNILSKFKQAHQSKKIISIIDVEDYESGAVTIDKDTLTWIYVADNVTDFAFATSNHYLWQATTLELSNKNVLISSVFDRKSQDFYEVTEISRKSIEFFSNEMPEVDYPYPTMTVFNGKGGMEFPMMVNDGSFAQRASTVHVTSHEIVHTYFPFYMGINEQMFAFMDEGWATMLPFELQSRLAPPYDPIARIVILYEQASVSSFEVPLMLPAIAISGNVHREAYRNSAYTKSGLAYYYLKEVMGEELFKKALHEFMNRWNGKHPLPYDFFNTFNEVAGEDLSWFWIPWFFETGYPDLAIQSLTSDRSRSGHIIRVKKEGSIPVPILITLNYADGSSEIIEKSARVWDNGNQTYDINIKGRRQIRSVVLGGTGIPDVNKKNNLWQRK